MTPLAVAGPSCAGVCLVSSGEADWAPVEAAARTGARHALGVHPWQAHEQREGWGGRLREELLRQPTAAVGEAGLDRARREIPCGRSARREAAERLWWWTPVPRVAA